MHIVLLKVLPMEHRMLGSGNLVWQIISLVFYPCGYLMLSSSLVSLFTRSDRLLLFTLRVLFPHCAFRVFISLTSLPS